MPTVTFNCTKDASSLSPYDAWSGWDAHHPVGTSPSGNRYISYVYFPANFAGMTSITSATLKLYGANVANVTHLSHTSASLLRIRRMTSDWGEGTNRGETLWSTYETWNDSNRGSAYTGTGMSEVTTGPTSDGFLYSYDVTEIVRAWAPTAAGGIGAANYGFNLRNNSILTADGLEYYSRHVSGKVPQLTITYVDNTPPNAPISLSPAGGTVVGLNPTFTGTQSDPNPSDTISAFQVIAYSDAGGATQAWDSGAVAGSGVTFSIACGVNLSGNATHSWKGRTRDSQNAWGPFSAVQTFVSNTAPPTPTGLSPGYGSTVQTITPTFSGTSTDPDAGDQLNAVQVIAYNDAGGSSVRWDSGTVAATGTTFALAYSGAALATGTSYYWMARTRDTNNWWSGFTPLQNFATYQVGTPTGMSPSNSKVNTLTPTLSATAAEPMTSYDLDVYASDGATILLSYSTAATGTAVSYVYAGPGLQWGTKYFWRLRTWNSIPNASAYTGLQPFWTNAAPSAAPSYPVSGYIPELAPNFESLYLDGDKSNGFSDDPTNYTVEVIDGANVIMHTLAKTTGLNGSSNSVARVAEGTPLAYHTSYRWRARYTDSSAAPNALGAFSGYYTFMPVVLGVVSAFTIIAADLTAGLLNKPNPGFSWAYTATQSRFRVVTRDVNGTEVHNTGDYIATGIPASFIPAGILRNNSTYTFTVTVTNAYGLVSAPVSLTVLTSWSPPATIQNVSATGDDTKGYIRLDWDQTTLVGADFQRYVVYRTEDAGGLWTVFASITDPTNNKLIDHAAGFGKPYSYKVTQFQNWVGDAPLESLDSDVATTVIAGDEWWLVVAYQEALSMSIVVEDESHESPFQQETFSPFGRTRKVIVRSGILGREGSLTFYILAATRVADEKKLAGILALNTPIYLKNPFGDVNLVFLDAPKVSYLTGGHVKMSCSYTEVD